MRLNFSFLTIPEGRCEVDDEVVGVRARVDEENEDALTFLDATANLEPDVLDGRSLL
jgi:hypothetical protein